MWLAFALGVQKVELVGGESWLEHNSVAIAAITAAALAAFVAIANHRAQLRHDRAMRNRDHTKDAIDTAVVAANELRIRVDRFFAAVKTEEENREAANYSQSDARLKALMEKRQDVLAGLHAMRAERTRLEIRLDESDPIVETYVSMFDAFIAVAKATFAGISEDRSPELREGDATRKQELRTALAAFQAACRAWFADPPRRRFGLGGRDRPKEESSGETDASDFD